jgi:Fe2+ transport system protein FeoA
MNGTLDQLRSGDIALVRDITGDGRLRHRLGGLGIRPGDAIEVLREVFLGGPVLLRNLGTRLREDESPGDEGTIVALGRTEASMVEVQLLQPDFSYEARPSGNELPTEDA